MKILLLAQFVPPVTGGIERHVSTLVEALTTRGHEIVVVTFATEDSGAHGPGLVEADGVRTIRVRTAASRLPGFYADTTRPWPLPFPDPIVSREIRKELSGGGFDLVHAHDWSVSSALGPATKAGIPVVVTMHDYGHSCATKRMLYHGTTLCEGPAVRRCLSCVSTYYRGPIGPMLLAANAMTARRRAHQVVRFASVSQAVDESLRMQPSWLQGTTIRSEVIPNFIPDEIVVEEIPPIQDDAPLVYVGTVRADKGVQTLLDAYELLQRPPRLVVAGPADSGTEWRFPDGVEWLGDLPRDDVIDLVRSARAVIVPSFFPDPCPTVALEAMAAGRAVIGSDIGGIADILVQDVTGILVPSRDVAALARAITQLIIDPNTAATLGSAGRDRVREFTSSVVVDRIEKLYLSAIAEFEHLSQGDSRNSKRWQ